MGHARDPRQDEPDLLSHLAESSEVRPVEVHLDRCVEGRPSFDLLRQDDGARKRLVEGVLDLADDPNRILGSIELNHGLGEVRRVALALDQVVVVLRSAPAEEQVHALDAGVPWRPRARAARPRSWNRGRRGIEVELDVELVSIRGREELLGEGRRGDETDGGRDGRDGDSERGTADQEAEPSLIGAVEAGK